MKIVDERKKMYLGDVVWDFGIWIYPFDEDEDVYIQSAGMQIKDSRISFNTLHTGLSIRQVADLLRALQMAMLIAVLNDIPDVYKMYLKEE